MIIVTSQLEDRHRRFVCFESMKFTLCFIYRAPQLREGNHPPPPPEPVQKPVVLVCLFWEFGWERRDAWKQTQLRDVLSHLCFRVAIFHPPTATPPPFVAVMILRVTLSWILLDCVHV